MTKAPVPERGRRGVFPSAYHADFLDIHFKDQVFSPAAALIGLDSPFGVFVIGVDRISLDFRAANATGVTVLRVFKEMTPLADLEAGIHGPVHWPVFSGLVFELNPNFGPSRNDLRRHQCVITNLTPDTPYFLHIEVPGPGGKTAYAWEFRTATRKVIISPKDLKVELDGDPGAAGEMAFIFEAFSSGEAGNVAWGRFRALDLLRYRPPMMSIKSSPSRLDHSQPPMLDPLFCLCCRGRGRQGRFPCVYLI